ncbi:hypothetical protein [Actinokineospora sp. NBRC 105648]|uniref:hypothetical protein n=1 Tax=Actinokineospora sp. NBRC 105648 TaxID=3032206 RepID=UPI002554BCFA|nr:hypothetical protein [Actinokineospora sp. NBRC 105648]
MVDEPRVHNVIHGNVRDAVQIGSVFLGRDARPPPRQLPSCPRGFVGRAEELVDLAQVPGILVVAGAGGVGKT